MNNERFIAFSCCHIPFESKPAQEFLLSHIEEHKPHHVVCLGDLFDAAGASRFTDESDHDLLDEYRKSARYLEAIRNASPTAKHYWLLGNHEHRVQKKNAANLPAKVRRLCDWHSCDNEFSEWYQTPYRKSRRGCLKLGQIIFAHGFDFSVNSDEYEAIQLANNYGQAYTLVVRGHTHRPKPVTQCMRTQRIPLPFWSANAGTLCDIAALQEGYAHDRDVSQWGSAVVRGEFQVLKSPRMSKCWQAETVINKMGWQA